MGFSGMMTCPSRDYAHKYSEDLRAKVKMRRSECEVDKTEQSENRGKQEQRPSLEIEE